MKKILAIDVDGVVLDHPLGMMNWAISKGIKVGCTPAELYCYSMAPMFPHMTDLEIWKALEDFSEHDDFDKLPVIEGGQEAIEALRSAIPDLTVVAITAPGASDKTVASRIRNLEKFHLDDITVLGLGSSKHEHLQKLDGHVVFIDDLLSHVQTAEALGHRGILFRQPHNAEQSHRNVMTSWKQGQSMILDMLTVTPRQKMEMRSI